MPTSFSTSADRSWTAFLDLAPCARIASANCAPIDLTGFSAFIADCMTTDMRSQRIAASWRSVMEMRLSPRKVTVPLVMRAGSDSSCATAKSMVDLPQPDSPTTARNSPRPTVNETSSTARTGPPLLVAYSTERPDTSSTAELLRGGRRPAAGDGEPAALPHGAQRGVADLVERVVEQRERGAEERD